MLASYLTNCDLTVEPEGLICIDMFKFNAIVVSCSYRISTKTSNHQMNNSLKCWQMQTIWYVMKFSYKLILAIGWDSKFFKADTSMMLTKQNWKSLSYKPRSCKIQVTCSNSICSASQTFAIMYFERIQMAINQNIFSETLSRCLLHSKL